MNIIKLKDYDIILENKSAIQEKSNKDYKYLYYKYKRKYIHAKQLYGGVDDNDDDDDDDERSQIYKLLKKIGPYLDLLDKYSGIIKTLAKGAAVAATIASLGLGGDTAVEFGVVTLDSLQLLNSFIKLHQLFEDSDDYYDIIKLLLSTEFKGVDKMDKPYQNLKDKINDLDTKDEFVGKLCEPIHDLLEKLATLVGDAISTGIPDDNFIASTIIQKLITDGIDKGTTVGITETIKGLDNNYGRLPDSFKSVLQDPDKMAEMIKSVFTLLKRLRQLQLMTNPLSFFGKDKFVVVLEIIIKNRKMIAKVINKSIALLYMILHFIKDYCIENDSKNSESDSSSSDSDSYDN